jgi:hypothetical protein
MSQMPKIEQPDDVEKVIAWLQYSKFALKVSGPTNQHDAYALAFARAIAEQFPDEEHPAGALSSETQGEISIVIRTRLMNKIDWPKMKARFVEIVKAEIEV